jgi:tRNA-splicing ligase RtcB
MLKIETENAAIKLWTTDGLELEQKAMKQLRDLAELPIIFKHVAVMPDVHFGYGTTVGTVFASQNAIIPAAVGVDIGCGMTALNTHVHVNAVRDRKELRALLESVVPHGRSNNGDNGDTGSWDVDDIPEDVMYVWKNRLESEFNEIVDSYRELGRGTGKIRQLGTLGTGNHFLEITVDENDEVWVLLHTGSRGIGAHIGDLYSEIAYQDLEAWTLKTMPNRSLAHIPRCSKHFHGYIKASMWAQKYAVENRSIIMQRALQALANYVGDKTLVPKYCDSKTWIDCYHNYIAFEHHFNKNVMVTRKGAVRAYKRDYCIIPGSMGACTYIARGLGNTESFMSCSHGAGRKLSRDEAMKSITLEQHVTSTAGVECCKDASVLDETPLAYKDIDLVMEAQRTLVEPIRKLKQIICIKGLSS